MARKSTDALVLLLQYPRRSPSYENRLSKYSHRGFEVHWPLLDRSRVDPTIFERSFARTLGLSRLLVLEALPRPDDRDAYLSQRRADRGKPHVLRPYRKRPYDNSKKQQPDDVIKWVEEEEASNYHTFQVPYGPTYHARKIEELLYSKDLQLNAEWKQGRKDRTVSLHRHPCFFGDIDDILKDCCGHCPLPLTDEEENVVAEESEVYVSGDLHFITADPGRQAIGSFSTLTEDDWTAMAYVGNTARLCQAIVDGDLEHVQEWCGQANAKTINRSDHTGRTPLHLAAMVSTPEVVQCLIDHGARLFARLLDGFTALHIAARRGNASIVKVLLDKSEANAAEVVRRAELKKRSRQGITHERSDHEGKASLVDDHNYGDEADDLDADDGSEDSQILIEGPFVKISSEKFGQGGIILKAEDQDKPDVYNVDVLAWDLPVSALHLAILGGHVDVIETLCSAYGADVSLPIKIMDPHNRGPRAVIMTLTLAQLMGAKQSEAVTKSLLQLGASSAQADMRQISALQYSVYRNNLEVLKTLFEYDEPAARSVLNHLNVGVGCNPSSTVASPLLTAIQTRNVTAVNVLLLLGAQTSIGREDFSKLCHHSFDHNSYLTPIHDWEQHQHMYKTGLQQPIVLAVERDLPTVVQELLQRDGDPNTLTKTGQFVLLNPHNGTHQEGTTLLDAIREKLVTLRDCNTMKALDGPPEPLQPRDFYLAGLEEGTYQYWSAKTDVDVAENIICKMQVNYEHSLQAQKEKLLEKSAALLKSIQEFEIAERMVIERGGKTFAVLHPDNTPPEKFPNTLQYCGSLYVPAKPFEVTLDFNIPEQTEMTRAGYLQLFEAAWDGNSSKVKSMTLAPWGRESNYSPLQVATWDSKGFSPFSIAVFRGHYELAKNIVNIANAQYQPSERSRPRYSVRPFVDDDRNESDDYSEVNLYSELVDDEFTNETLGALANIVKSNVTSLRMLTANLPLWRLPRDSIRQFENAMAPLQDQVQTYRGFDRKPWSIFKHYWDSQHAVRNSLLHYALWRNDSTLSKFYLQLGTRLSAQQRESDKPSTLFQVDDQDFRYALRKGRTTILAQIIEATGAGIPLDAIVKNSGIELQGKPKYYHGLSIRGKMNKDRAEAGRRLSRRPIEAQHPPLLEAAYQGSAKSTEWLLSDAAIGIYRHFAEQNQDDNRPKSLSTASGGITTMLTTWLGTRSELALHCAILSQAGDENVTELVKYLIEVMPQTLETTSQDGYTPLLLAFSLNRFAAAQLLIEAGANPRKVDGFGRNILHLLLAGMGTTIEHEGDLKRLLALIDGPVLQELFTQRDTTNPGAQTPLARWLDRLRRRQPPSGDTKGERDVLKLILSRSEGADLEVMDGSGQFPLHTAVRWSQNHIVETMVERNPTLLHRENATGQTPLDLAETKCLQYNIHNPPNMQDGRGFKLPSRPGQMPPDFGCPERMTKPDVRSIWHVCMEAAERFPGKRMLVPLNDANDVSKRLAITLRTQSQDYVDTQFAKDDMSDPRDEVAEWYQEASLALQRCRISAS